LADIYKPLDFSSTNPRRCILPVDTADRPAGDIAYLMAYPDYQETYTYSNGAVQQMSAYVKWGEANDFIDFTLGYTTWVRAEATRFHRVLPMASQYQNTLFADSCSMAEFGLLSGSVRSSESAGKWMEVDWARYAIEFRSRKYDMATDATLDSGSNPWNTYGCKELGRYVERIARYTPEERVVNQFKLAVTNPANASDVKQIADLGFTPFYKGEIVYIWYQVPYDAVPLDAIGACAGCVNNTNFDLKYDLAGTTLVPRYTTETMLFKGLGQELDPYPGPNGELLVDVHYLFGWQPRGWNFFPDPTNPDPAAAWWPVTRRGVTPARKLYGPADFRALFKPRTS